MISHRDDTSSWMRLEMPPLTLENFKHKHAAARRQIQIADANKYKDLNSHAPKRRFGKKSSGPVHGYKRIETVLRSSGRGSRKPGQKSQESVLAQLFRKPSVSPGASVRKLIGGLGPG